MNNKLDHDYLDLIEKLNTENNLDYCKNEYKGPNSIITLISHIELEPNDIMELAKERIEMMFYNCMQIQVVPEGATILFQGYYENCDFGYIGRCLDTDINVIRFITRYGI